MKANPDKFQAICIGKKTHDNIESFQIGQKNTLAQSSKRSPLNHHVFDLLTRAFGSSLISYETSWNGFLYDISQYNMSKHEIKLAKND